MSIATTDQLNAPRRLRPTITRVTMPSGNTQWVLPSTLRTVVPGPPAQFVFPEPALATAVDRVSFAYLCPKQVADLEDLGQARYHCGTCAETVTYVTSAEEGHRLGQAGHCVVRLSRFISELL